MLIMLAMVIAYALLPRVRDIKRIVASSPAEGYSAIADFNRRSEQVVWKTQGTGSDKTPDVLETSDTFTEPAIPALPVGWATGSIGWTTGVYPASPQTSSNNRPAEGAAVATSSPARGSSLGSANEEPYAERSRTNGRFRVKCETIANRYLLSRRETEVLFLLAKGYNAAYIQDKLCVSKSTAKTHISHIYRKLDIHTQQELLYMVEEAREES